MIRILTHFALWFICSLAAYLYVLWNITEELFYQLLIGMMVIAIITYIAQFEKRMIPVAIVAIVLSTSIVYYFVI